GAGLRRAYGAGVGEVETNLVMGADLERRNDQAFVVDGRIVAQDRQADARQAMPRGVRQQRVAFDISPVQAQGESRFVFRGRRRIAIAYIQWNAVVTPHEKVGGQAQVDRDGLGAQPLDLELAYILL